MHQIRYLNALPMVRRVVRRLIDSTAADKAVLANTRRALNMSGLQNNSILAAAPPKRKPAATAPAKKAKGSAGTAKPPAKKTAPSSSINIRGGGAGGFGGDKVTVEKSITVKTQKQILELSQLLELRQAKLSTAEHIKTLLVHQFDNDDPIVVRLTKLVNALIAESQELLEEVQDALHSIGSTFFSPAFKETIDTIFEELALQFEDKFKSFTKKLSVSQGTYKGNPATFFIGYLIFDNLKGNIATQDYVVVVTQVVENIGNQNVTNKKAKGNSNVGMDTGKAANFIRTLTDYRAPTWVMRHHLGVSFGSDTDRAVNSVLLTMQSEDMLDAISKTGVPIKSDSLKFTHDLVDGARIIEDDDILRVYLDPKVTSAKTAQDALSSLYAEVKNMIKSVHPRYKNPIKALPPRPILTNRTVSGKATKVKRFAIDFMFSKPEGAPDIELPREKIKKFMELFDIDDPNVARDFTIELKRFLGAK